MTYAKLNNDVVTAIFSCDQDPEEWPDVVALENNDERLLAYLKKLEEFGIKRFS